MTNFKDIFCLKKSRKTHRKRREYQDREVQPCLPLSRPRALSLPLPTSAQGVSTTKLKQWTSPQLDSRLMRLPVELRLLIYKAVLGRHTVHVEFSFGVQRSSNWRRKQVLEWRWWHTICTWDQTEDERFKNIFNDACCRSKKEANRGPPNGMMGKLRLDIALLFICRRVYSEVIDILYRTTTFNLHSHELFRNFPSLILPHRFSAITSLEQVWIFVDLGIPEVPVTCKTRYNEMWGMLAAMPNLCRLKIATVAYECPYPVPKDLQETWLHPLQQLRGKDMETFELWVPESYASQFEVGDSSNFTVHAFLDVPSPDYYAIPHQG